MSDTKTKVDQGIDDAAQKAKETTDKVVDSSKDAAHSVGEKVKETGQKIKDASK